MCDCTESDKKTKEAKKVKETKASSPIKPRPRSAGKYLNPIRRG